MAPIGEMAPGCAKKYNKEILKNPFAPGAISRMITAFLFPRSQKIINFHKNRTLNRTKTPISFIFFWTGFAFWGLEPNNNYVGQHNLQLPRANEHIA